ncbi:MAG: oxidoreductase [Lentisphaerae bacterium RIFOXYA12_FULL_48_11]|nr:MAG: oxidoreductase [Lentisphaerae bacterium RIFOXYA12_FULL_48_11]
MNIPHSSIPKGARILVTGATGFTGSLLTRKLAENGAIIHAIARSSSKIESLQDLNIRWFRGEVYDPATVKTAMEGVSYVFHLAAVYREAKAGEDMNHKVHVESTKLLAETAKTIPSFQRFVHISTVGVHGHIENPPADENYPFNPGDIYQKTKAEAELWLKEYAKTTGLPFTVIRPAAIYGPGDTRLLKVFKMAAWPVFPILGNGKCLYHLIHVDDLTSVMILTATHPAALNETFICGNPDPIKLEEIGRTIASELGMNTRVIRLPAWPFFALGAVCEAVCKPFGIEPPIYRRRVAFFTKDRAFNTSKLQEKLGYSYKYSNKEGLIQTARWYVENGWL